MPGSEKTALSLRCALFLCSGTFRSFVGSDLQSREVALPKPQQFVDQGTIFSEVCEIMVVIVDHRQLAK